MFMEAEFTVPNIPVTASRTLKVQVPAGFWPLKTLNKSTGKTICSVVLLQSKALPESSNCMAKVEFVDAQSLLNSLTTVPCGFTI
ncbi:hypothetical protein D3C85_1631920 [compost metagenome]